MGGGEERGLLLSGRQSGTSIRPISLPPSLLVRHWFGAFGPGWGGSGLTVLLLWGWVGGLGYGEWGVHCQGRRSGPSWLLGGWIAQGGLG